MKIYLQSFKTAKDTGKCNLTNLQNWCNVDLNIISFYGNVHSKLSLVSMLKDHMTLLNLLNLHGFCYPLNFFGVCCLTIVKIGDTTNVLYKPRFHADRSRDRF